MQAPFAPQPRRIAFAVLVAFFAVWMQTKDIGASTFIALCISGFVFGLGRLSPASNRWVDCFAFGAILGSLIPAAPLSVAWSSVLIAALLHIVVYGPFAARLPIEVALSRQSRAVVSGSALSIWKKLIPGESHPEDHCSGRLTDFNRDADDPQTLYLTFDDGQNEAEMMTLDLLGKSAPMFCRFHLEADAKPSGQGITQNIALREIGPDTTEITIKSTCPGLTLGEALALWFAPPTEIGLPLGRLPLKHRTRWRVGIKTNPRQLGVTLRNGAKA